MRASAGVAVVICAVGLGLWSAGFWSMSREAYYGGIACHEVQENMPAMVAGTLPDELRVRIEAHLRECPLCRGMMQNMQASQAATSVPFDYWTCECLECRFSPHRCSRRYQLGVVQVVPSKILWSSAPSDRRAANESRENGYRG